MLKRSINCLLASPSSLFFSHFTFDNTLTSIQHAQHQSHFVHSWQLIFHLLKKTTYSSRLHLLLLQQTCLEPASKLTPYSKCKNSSSIAALYAFKLFLSVVFYQQRSKLNLGIYVVITIFLVLNTIIIMVAIQRRDKKGGACSLCLWLSVWDILMGLGDMIWLGFEN